MGIKNIIGINYTCLKCGKDFVDHKSNFHRKYCSISCAMRSKVKKSLEERLTKHHCVLCQKEFFAYPKDNRRYCSTACVNKSRARPPENRLLNYFCKICGKKILGSESSDRKFCSNACANKGRLWLEESRTKARLSHIGKKLGAMKEETKNKIRIAKIGKPSKLKGIPMRPEAKIKLSISLKKYNAEHPRTNSAETRIKISKGNKGKTKPESVRVAVAKSNAERVYSVDCRNKHSVIFKEMWRNQEYIDKRSFKNISMGNNKNELLMKDILLTLGLNFISQKRIKDIEHSYISDFFLPDYNLVIECDGIFFHGHPKHFPVLTAKQILQKQKDEIRSRELLDAGYKLLRFWQYEFDLEVVRNKLLEVGVLNDTNVSV